LFVRELKSSIAVGTRSPRRILFSTIWLRKAEISEEITIPIDGWMGTVTTVFGDEHWH